MKPECNRWAQKKQAPRDVACAMPVTDLLIMPDTIPDQRILEGITDMKSEILCTDRYGYLPHFLND